MLTRLTDWWTAKNLDRRVRKHGWTGVYVGRYGDAPAWTYSLGFDETLNQPEVVIFDVPQESAQTLLWQAFDELKNGQLQFEDGATWSGGAEPAPKWRKVHPSQISGIVGWLGLAERRRFKRTGQRSGLEAFQLVLPDAGGHFPWEAGYDEHLRPLQPALYLPENDPDARDMLPEVREARRLLAERGWTIVPVEGPRLSWAYSIGLAETLGSPDLIAFGGGCDIARTHLVEVQQRLRKGELTLEDGLRWSGLGFEVCWRSVHESQYLGFNWFYLAKEVREEWTGRREPVPVFQMFVADPAGLYPWEAGCDQDFRELQPMLSLAFDPAQQPS